MKELEEFHKANNLELENLRIKLQKINKEKD